MFWKPLLTAALVLAPAVASFAQEPQGEENPIEALKKILAQMQVAEKLLARMSLEKGSEAEKKITEDLEKLAPDAVSAEEKAVKDLSRMMDDVQKRMSEIVASLQKFLDSAELSESQGQSEMETPEAGKPKEEKGQQKDGAQKDDKLEKMGQKDESKGGASGGEEESPKAGQADKSYTPKKKPEVPVDPARKADGSGRWGTLPPKIFNDIVHPDDFPKPRKYEDLIQKYFEMLSKMSKNE